MQHKRLLPNRYAPLPEGIQPLPVLQSGNYPPGGNQNSFKSLRQKAFPVSNPTHVREVQVPSYAIRSDKMNSQSNPSKHLMLPLTLSLGTGHSVKVNALVDTGAQTNLINEDLIPKGCQTWARDQLHLVAANGLKIPGGNYEVLTKTRLQKETAQGSFVGVQDFEASFHVAQISLDAILSYPWLAENGLVVGPQKNSLMLPHPEQLLLRPVEGREGTLVRRQGKAGKARVDHNKVGKHGVCECVVQGQPKTIPAAQGRSSNNPGLGTSGLEGGMEGGIFPGPLVSGVSSQPKIYTPLGRHRRP